MFPEGQNCSPLQLGTFDLHPNERMTPDVLRHIVAWRLHTAALPWTRVRERAFRGDTCDTPWWVSSWEGAIIRLQETRGAST